MFHVLITAYMKFRLTECFNRPQDEEIPVILFKQQGAIFTQSDQSLFVPRHEKTSLCGFRPGLTQTSLYRHRRKLEDLRHW